MAIFYQFNNQRILLIYMNPVDKRHSISYITHESNTAPTNNGSFDFNKTNLDSDTRGGNPALDSLPGPLARSPKFTAPRGAIGPGLPGAQRGTSAPLVPTNQVTAPASANIASPTTPAVKISESEKQKELNKIVEIVDDVLELMRQSHTKLSGLIAQERVLTEIRKHNNTNKEHPELQLDEDKALEVYKERSKKRKVRSDAGTNKFSPEDLAKLVAYVKAQSQHGLPPQ